MNNITEEVGKRIRFYRKQRKLTLEQLSNSIMKSKATVSKYESGKISIDIETLFDIVKSLDISVYQLLDIKEKGNDEHTYGENNNSELYCYYYDGIKNRMVKCLLRLISDSNNRAEKAHFYVDVPSFNEYYKCMHYYIGDIYHYDLMTYIVVENKANSIENVTIYIENPLHQCEYTSGLLLGIYSKPLMPIAIKILVTKHVVENTDFIMGMIKLSKEELKKIKRYNMFMCDSIKRDSV